MSNSDDQDSHPLQDPEVRAYLKRLLLSIALGILLVTGTAVWAWNTYAPRMKDAPPLPEGTPPLSTVPATPN